MSKIALVTDSTSDLDLDFAKDRGVRIIPLRVHIDGQAFLDGIDLQREDLVRYLETSDILPTTSQPSPGDFVAIYEDLAREGYDAVISLHLSQELSGTVNGARLAADQVKSAIDVRVYDSRTATAGLGLQIMRLVAYLEKDPDLNRACGFLEDLIGHTKVFFLLGSLDSLAKGGRIGQAAYLVGSLLQVKPVLVLEDGVISVYDKLRTRKISRAIGYLVDLMEENDDDLFKKKGAWLIGFNNDCLGTELKNQLQERGLETSYPDFQIGTVVTTHIGLDAVGIFLVTTEGDYSHVFKE